MKKIKLTQGKYTLVDDKDYKKLNRFKWCVGVYTDSLSYAMRSKKKNGRWISCCMQKEIIGIIPKNTVIDHIDGNGLNNQRKNLRIATVSQNGMNRKDNCNNVSGFRGVSYNKKAKKWQSQTMSMGKPIYLGLYKDILEAANAYKMFANENYKNFKRIYNDKRRNAN